MTIPQLVRLCKLHGHALFCRPDGTPVVKKMRTDAVLPNDVQQQLIDNRQAIVAWFLNPGRQEWETCSVCKADVHGSMNYADADVLCGRAATKKSVRCPYRDPEPSRTG